MTAEQYAQAPATLTVRELRVGGETLVTTLLSPKQVPKNELRSLYRQRWNVELDFPCLKATIGMETLSCKSPAMAIKEIWVYLLAYNLIRRMMLQGACIADLLPRQLSFRHAAPLCMAYRQHLVLPGPETLKALLRLIARRRVGQRSGRIEPRAHKRRPKAFPPLTRHRYLAREGVRVHGHPKR
ncbi:transposase [Pseudomonas stutzeri]|nr:transposase [Stutzerimonas stutzeri]MCQ4323133.1 transposase [Stutzerimonas stutzeri]